MEEPGLAFVAALHVTLSPALRIGEVGHGQREIIPITGGTVSGPLLNGRILPGGEDWALDGEEGRFSVWARYALELDDGTLVTVDNRGLGGTAPDGRFVGRTVPRFEVADGPHAWLRHSVFVGTLAADPAGAFVDLRFYRVT